MGTRTGTQTGALRVVLDTNVVVSALLFPRGLLARVRTSWQRAEFLPLADRNTLDELVRVLGYPKFALTKDDVAELLAAFLPYVEVVTGRRGRGRALPPCRDPDDVKFLALARSGRARVLVTGDAALLELAPQVPFAIGRPADFLKRLGGEPPPV